MNGTERVFTILHGSDLHFGRPHAPAAARDFLALAHSVSPDLIALSGDFTQRAKNREYEAAAEYLKRLPRVPLVVTPGNHDVPLYRLWERAAAPFRNYRRWIADELESEHDVDGTVVVALNTTTPDRSIVNGKVTDEQLERAAAAFARARDGGLRALVVHHALVGAPGGDRIAALPRARRIVRRLTEMGVELVMFGHLHRAFVGGGPAQRIGARRGVRAAGVQRHHRLRPRARLREGQEQLQPAAGVERPDRGDPVPALRLGGRVPAGRRRNLSPARPRAFPVAGVRGRRVTAARSPRGRALPGGPRMDPREHRNRRGACADEAWWGGRLDRPGVPPGPARDAPRPRPPSRASWRR